MFTIAGFTVSTSEQARSILMIAVMNRDVRIATQAKSVIGKLEAMGK